VEPRGQVLTAVYLESSALTRLLFEEDLVLGAVVADAPLRLASALTFLETDRAITGSALRKAAPRAKLAAAAQALAALRNITRLALIDGDVLERARQIFPVEPVRSLDAIHLATALILRESLGPLTILSLDQRVRQNAAALGFPLLPP
jgi:hypothetical protein